MWRRLLNTGGLVAVIAGAAVLAGCGTPYATVDNAAGEPVMLLGHDPVAYFTRGMPVRGSAQHKVSLPSRTTSTASSPSLLG